MPSRREFVVGLLGAGVSPLVPLTKGAVEHAPGQAVHPEFPSQDPELVREIVGASHARLDDVTKLVTASPALAKAAWDWGFGDWESALGAASHMGR
ncbi:MAG: hypothetical protein R3344_05360, partial [Acidobacteriota bacterium]|nr:hypothetical protein [Acidobacteriota bacterium]